MVANSALAQLDAHDGDERGDVDVFVGVDTEDDLFGARVGLCVGVCVRHAGHGCSSPDRSGRRMVIAGPARRSEL
jgi:hypothetical protein